jgi:hypothetical protein
MVRKLRIAASVFFAVATVALCVLWVRSYWWADSIGDSRQPIYFTSIRGQIHAQFAMSAFKEPYLHNWGSLYGSREDEYAVKGFRLRLSQRSCIADLPYWSIAIALGTAALLPWLTVRFSLRTLLIATTLVALVLGLGVWAAS